MIESCNPIPGKKIAWYKDQELKPLGVNLHEQRPLSMQAPENPSLFCAMKMLIIRLRSLQWSWPRLSVYKRTVRYGPRNRFAEKPRRWGPMIPAPAEAGKNIKNAVVKDR